MPTKSSRVCLPPCPQAFTGKRSSSSSHAVGCDYYKAAPETNDQKVARLEAEVVALGATQRALNLILNGHVPVAVAYHNTEEDTCSVQVLNLAGKSDAIVLEEGAAVWASTWRSHASTGHSYARREVADKILQLQQHALRGA